MPKVSSRSTALYFDKSRIKKDRECEVKEEIKKNKELEFSNQRDDLLHVINLECVNDKIRIKKHESGNLLSLENMVDDMKNDNSVI